MRPDLVWMAWSGFGQLHVVQKQASVQESLGLVLAERNQPATSSGRVDFYVRIKKKNKKRLE